MKKLLSLLAFTLILVLGFNVDTVKAVIAPYKYGDGGTGTSTPGQGIIYSTSTNKSGYFQAITCPVGMALVGSTTSDFGFGCGTAGGGTSTPSFGAAGTVQFASTTPGEFNSTSTFFWDNVNGRLGVASGTPVASLSVTGNINQNGVYSHFGNKPCKGSLVGFGEGLELCGTENSDSVAVQLQAGNNSNGGSAYAGLTLNNDLADNTLTHFYGMYLNSSGYNSTTFGTALAVPNLGILQDTDGPLAIGASTSTAQAYISFLTGGMNTGNERMRILANGNIGIATTTPTTSFVNASTTSTTTATAGFDAGSGALKYDWAAQLTTIDNAEVGAFNFPDNAGAVSWANMLASSSQAIGTIESYIAQLNSNPMLLIYGEANGSGGMQNLGISIGTTSAPHGKLSVWANGQTTGTAFEINNTASTTVVTILDNGSTGLGSTTPAATLGVKATAGTVPFIVASSTNNEVLFKVNNDSRVAVGSSSPNARFVVQGTSSQPTLDLVNISSSTAPIVTVAANGNTGFGSSTPNARVVVKGIAGTGDQFAISSSSDAVNFKITAKGNISLASSTASTPALTVCGTSPTILGTNNAGHVFPGATAAGCTVTFANGGYANNIPACVVTPETGSILNTFSYTISKTVLTVTETGLTNFSYACFGFGE